MLTTKMPSFGFLAAALSLLFSSNTQAASILKCGDMNNIGYIPDPIAENYRTFNKGLLTIVTVDSFGDPVSGSSHAIINIADPKIGDSHCFQLSQLDDGTGYSWV